MFKSIKTGVIAAILISTAIIAHAQKKVSEGVITYKMAYSPAAGQEQAVGMLPTEMKSSFNANFNKFSMQAGPATLTFIMNYHTNSGLMLLDVPIAQWQYAVKQTTEDMAKAKANSPKFVDFKATGEKKMIGDYNAEKYTYKDDKGGSYELWATTDLELPAGYFGEEFKDVKGTLLVYTQYINGVKGTSTFKSVSESKVGDLNVDLPKGYEYKTMEEIQAMRPGGGE
jgi:hypothetical protein